MPIADLVKAVCGFSFLVMVLLMFFLHVQFLRGILMDDWKEWDWVQKWVCEWLVYVLIGTGAITVLVVGTRYFTGV